MLLVPDCKENLSLHILLRGYYGNNGFEYLVTMFLHVYSYHDFVFAFIKDHMSAIPLQITSTMGFEGHLVNKVGRFTSECIEQCISMIKYTKYKSTKGMPVGGMATNYFQMLPDPLQDPEPLNDAMFTASGFVFYFAEDGTMSRVMGMLTSHLHQEDNDNICLDKVMCYQSFDIPQDAAEDAECPLCRKNDG